MEPRIPEKNKRAGLVYAVTDDGLELPVIDITHPAFACETTEAEISASPTTGRTQKRCDRSCRSSPGAPSRRALPRGASSTTAATTSS